jgi:hypothetical protein
MRSSKDWWAKVPGWRNNLLQKRNELLVKTRQRRAISWGDVARLTLVSIICAFTAAFLLSLHQCFHSADLHAESPVGMDFLFIDVVVAVVVGPVVALLTIGAQLVALRYFRLRAFTNGGLFVTIVVLYVILTTYFVVTNPPGPGSCRLDW